MYVEKMKAAIEKQIEKEYEFSPLRGCAAQLTDIVGSDERLAQIVCEDFDNKRTVIECEKKIISTQITLMKAQTLQTTLVNLSQLTFSSR